MSRIALDVRRVGGLEGTAKMANKEQIVVRRVGGLEAPDVVRFPADRVVRRVGGLEGVGGYHM